METQSKDRFPYGQGCVALFVCLLLLLFAAYLQDMAEVMGSFLFALFIIWQVIRGLIVKRYFWQVPEEKVSFWALLAALLLGCGMLWLCLQQARMGNG